MRKSLANGYRLITAKIIYHRPDYIHLLQEFVWQDLDLFPRLPELKKFLHYWETHLDGPIHSVEVAGGTLLKPQELMITEAELRLH